MKLVVEADGGSRGNPGPAGYGAVVKDPGGQILAEAADSIGVATNNVAEYQGLIAGLRSVLAVAGDGASVEVRMDSKLVIEQMAGRWKIKNEGLRPLATEAGGLARRLRVTWKWIPRERNRDADRLANEAMDAAAKGTRWQGGTVPETFTPPPPDPTAPASGATTPASGAPAPESSWRPPGWSATAASSPRQEAVHEPLFDLTPTPPAASERPATPQPPTAPAPVTASSGEAASTGGRSASASAPGGSGGATEAGARSERKKTDAGGWAGQARTATSLLLLRHGQTPLSVERRFSGLGDPELTSEGLRQAEAAAAHLAGDPYVIDTIVSSPLRRARRTAEAVAARTGLTVTVDDGLRELDFGDWEGFTFTEIQRRWPADLKAWLDDPAVAPPGGESFEQAAERVLEVKERLLLDHAGETVLIVSHVTPIKMLLRFALLAPPAALYRMHLDIASLSAVSYFPDGPELVTSFNNTSYLR
ncbi:bifunctional RNase H/acid phosphatase [Sphaerisporangium sp. TRM90804]|uniref:bifunctional RNase H/acid phosphatase n=1 Tax=Sphaerisporangium sp. TRM90804 TaxID=3031113 RepID=UPI00244C1008|nr:bifunctional RNase H/acid phosphatase [Sphaerisporangium sp. TRM90804]MDH2424324.1 bifunctional RNase H/acid phosphatase [Sphaerisporangium sp. TRM90804]